jgi:hypothetical protein
MTLVRGVIAAAPPVHEPVVFRRAVLRKASLLCPEGEAGAEICALVDAGATWYGEYIPLDAGDLEMVRACIARGPRSMD